jgi:SAM-dependent methyltransferase
MSSRTVDDLVVADFGREWQAFDPSEVPPEELARQFESYFAVFPWGLVARDAAGFDAGCGSGRWARFVAPRVGRLHCIDASAQAVEVARRTLADCSNVEFHIASVSALPLPAESMDFGYSLGVLHHVPDTERALRECVSRLRVGAPFLVYLYYALDGRPAWFRALFSAVNALRRRVSDWPHRRKLVATNTIAVAVYLPLARLAKLGERLGRDVDPWPLSFYRDRSLYTMRNDALDRFGTRLEQRFTREQIVAMLERAGLVGVRVSPDSPYWCACGIKAEPQAARGA